jgi:hypothetical protein
VKKTLFIILLLGATCVVSAQNIDELVEKIYQASLQQEEAQKGMGDYTYRQTVHFIKYDGDDEIDEQSERSFRVFARPPELTRRELLSARAYEDGEWSDVTEEQKSKRKGDRRSKSFSLSEVFGPEGRNQYTFTAGNIDFKDGVPVKHIIIEPIEPDEERFAGDLWFSEPDLALKGAALVPSENPTGVESMNMMFNMEKVGDYWLPSEIVFDAEISFLLIFNGKIHSVIRFDEYELGQALPDSLFEGIPSASDD